MKIDLHLSYSITESPYNNFEDAKICNVNFANGEMTPLDHDIYMQHEF